MKKTRIRLFSILLVLILLPTLVVVALAADTKSMASKDGIQAQLVTDKTSYISGETVEARVQVSNGSGVDAAVAVFIQVPEGVTLSEEAAASATRLEAGESYTTPGSGVGKAGGNVLRIVFLILEALVIAVAVIVLIFCNKKYRAVVNVLLVVAMIGGVGLLATPVQAADMAQQMHLSCPVTVDGNAAEVTATVVYTLYHEDIDSSDGPYVEPTEDPEETQPVGVAPAPMEIEGKLLLEEDFADLEGWTADDGAQATGSYAKINDAGQLEIRAGTDSSAGINYLLDDYSGKIAFTFEFTPDFSGSGKSAGIIMATVTGDKAAAISTYAYPNGFGYYDKEAKKVVKVGDEVVSGQAYSVTIIADTDADTYDLYVNSKLLAEKIAFRTPGTKFTRIMHSTAGSSIGVKATWDNLQIVQISAAKEKDKDSSSKIPYRATPDIPVPVAPADADDSRWIYRDTFNELGKWTTIGTSGTANSVNIKNGKLQIRDDAKTVVSAVRKLDQALTGKVVFEIDVSSNKLRSALVPAADKSAVYISVFGNGSAGNDKVAIDVRLYSDCVDFFTTQSNLYGYNFSTNTTYRLQIVANVEKNTYNLFINGKPVAANITMRNGTISELTKVRLWTTSAPLAATMTYDNLDIYYLNEAPEKPVDPDAPVLPDIPAPATPTESSDRRWIYQDTFENMNGWTSMGTSGTANTVGVVDGKLQLTDDANNRVSAVRGLATLTGDVVFEFEVAATELQASSGLYFEVRQGDTQAIDVRLFSDGIDCYTTGSNKATGTYTANTTYKVQIAADIAENTYNVFVDGKLVAYDVAMRNQVSTLNKIRLWTTSNDLAATVSYDNLYIYYLDADSVPPCNHENTEIRDARDANCTQAGYTGDTYCKDCDELLVQGQEIPTTGVHTYKKGVCAVCNAADPDYVVPPVAPSESTDSRWIYRDTFEDIGSWTAMGNNETNTVSVVDGKLQITDDADNRVSALRGLSTLTGEVVIEFEVASTALSATSGLYFTMWNSNTQAMDVRLFSDGVDCYTTQSNKVAGTYTANTTYKVQMVANITENTYTVYVDGDIVAKNIAMRNQVTGLNRIRLYTTSDALAATVTYDNLYIYYLNEVCAHTNTEVRDAKAATCVAAGYTGDTYCVECGELVAEGETIEATGIHNYVSGVCSGCGAADPDYVAPPVAPTESTDSRWIYHDTFESIGSWTSMGTSGTDNTLSVVDGKLQITDDANNRVSAIRGLTALTGEVVVEFEVSSTALSTNSGLYFTLWESNTQATDVRLYSNGIDCYTDKSNKVDGTYTANTIYKVQIVANVTKNTYNVFVDGELIAQDVAMRNQVSSLNRIRLWTTSNELAATVTYDNLKIYYLNEVCAHTNTELRNAKAATCGATGYTGDTYCTDCGELVNTGTETAATGNHSYASGVCAVCGAVDSSNVAPTAPTDSNDSRWIYQDTFESIGSWTSMGTSGTDNTLSVVDGKLQITDDANNRVSAIRGLAAMTGEVVVEFEVSSTALSTSSGLYFTLYEGNTQATDVRLFSDGIDCYTTKSNKVSGTYTANTAYKVQMVVNVTNHTYTVFVDGNLIVKDVAMRNQVTSLNRLRLWTSNNDLAATVTYDNLKIYKIA